MGQGASGASVDEKYFLQKVKLGQGSFGTVWRAIDRSNSNVVAIKQLDKDSLPRRGVKRSDIEREIAMMRACHHENLTKLFDTFEDAANIYLALEYCDGGDFGDKVKERGMNAQEPEVAEWMRQICAGVAALHSKGICHRDVKPDNFMIKTVREVSVLKLSDFGLAVYLPKGKLLMDKCGTPAFMAPEQHRLPKQSRGYGLAADVWATGVAMYMVMFGGRHPFISTNNQLDERLLLQGVLDFRVSPGGRFFGFDIGMGGELRFSEEARTLCSRLVQPDERQRLAMEDCLSSRWLQRGRPPPGPGATGSTTPTRRRQEEMRLPEERPVPAEPNGDAGGGGWWAKARQTPAPGPFPEPKRPPTEVRLLKAERDNLKQQLEEEKKGKEQLLAESYQMQQQMMEARNQEMLGRQQAPGGGQPLLERGPSVLGTLQAGTKCRYQSTTYGWMPAVVQAVNESDGTYDLDVRPHASLDRISPCSPATAQEAWPPRTSAAYHSSSVNKWVPAVVMSYNEVDGTYNLDVRDHAQVERIRARLGDQMPQTGWGDAQQAAVREASPGNAGDDMAMRAMPSWQDQLGRHPSKGSGALPDLEQRRPSAPAALAPGNRDCRDGSAPAFRVEELMAGAPWQPQQPAIHHQATGLEAAGSATPAGGPRVRLAEGMWCTVDGHGPALVEGVSDDGSVSVSLKSPAAMSQRMQVTLEQLRAPPPGDAFIPWPAGMKVGYESSSMGTWINATVTCYLPAQGKYNLDVREAAQPERMRPR